MDSFALSKHGEFKQTLGFTFYTRTITVQINDPNNRFPVNFRGWNGNDAIVIFDGKQMSMTKDRIFKNDVQKPKEKPVSSEKKESKFLDDKVEQAEDKGNEPEIKFRAADNSKKYTNARTNRIPLFVNPIER